MADRRPDPTNGSDDVEGVRKLSPRELETLKGGAQPGPSATDAMPPSAPALPSRPTD